ncbi:hypothetical protein [Streptomyces gardneri]|uniref:hypothetical protein n=1 Tax=Streptomyces gardneri TaxID=66892 RepID=UPI0035DD2B40
MSSISAAIWSCARGAVPALDEVGDHSLGGDDQGQSLQAFDADGLGAEFAYGEVGEQGQALAVPFEEVVLGGDAADGDLGGEPAAQQVDLIGVQAPPECPGPHVDDLDLDLRDQ